MQRCEHKHPHQLLRPQRDDLEAVARCASCGALLLLDAEIFVPANSPVVVYNAMTPEHAEKLNTQLPWFPAPVMPRAHN